MTSVQGGATEPVHAKTLGNNYEQMVVPVEGQADVLLLGIPYLGPYNVNSIMNPLLVYNMLLGYLFNLYRGKPLVREGGVIIGTHPMPADFNGVHHPSYVDLWNEGFAETHDIRELHHRYEERYANDPWYRTLYRNSYAYHGAHPFTVLYWAAHALDHVGDTILVGGDPATTKRMGLNCAASIAAALEMPGHRRPTQVSPTCTPPVFSARELVSGSPRTRRALSPCPEPDQTITRTGIRTPGKKADYREHRGAKRVAGVPARGILAHPPPEQEEGCHGARTRARTTHRGPIRAACVDRRLSRVRLEGEQRHRKTRDEQEHRTGFRASPYSPMEADGKDREQRPGEGEVEVLDPTIGTQG